MIDTAELDALKSQNLADIVGRYTTLHRVSGREFAGPCPRSGCDADDDGFHVGRGRDGSWFWFCRKCHPVFGDVVEFARWLHGYDFLQAVAWARGGVAVVEAMPRKPVHTVAAARAWDLVDVERMIDTACRALTSASDLGMAGRAYLARRALSMATADRFFVGVHMAWDRQLHATRPALCMPWARGDVVEAIKYRFCEVPTGGMRLTSESGSRYDGMFGRNAYGGRYDLVIITEGEINAMSVHQAARAAGWTWIDAVSVGGEGGAEVSTTQAATVAEACTDFARVLTWLDNPKYAAALRDGVPGARAIRSHVGDDGVKYDANELLQGGALQDFLSAVLGQLWPT